MKLFMFGGEMAKVKISAFADEASSLFQEQIDAMIKNGVEYLEMRGVNGRNVSEMTVDEVKSAALLLADYGLSVWSLGSPIGKIKITDDFAPEIERFKKLLEKASVCGAKCIRLFSFYGVDSPEKENEVFERLSKYVELSEGSNVKLCHENEKGIFGWNIENCVRILDANPSMRAVFDPANFVQCGVDTLKAWEVLAERTEYLHVKDALSDGSVVPAGYGIGNLEFIMNDFLNRGGKVFSLEPHLRVFHGLDKLEGGEKSVVGKFAYPDNKTAFAASAEAAKKLLGLQ